MTIKYMLQYDHIKLLKPIRPIIAPGCIIPIARRCVSDAGGAFSRPPRIDLHHSDYNTSTITRVLSLIILWSMAVIRISLIHLYIITPHHA